MTVLFDTGLKKIKYPVKHDANEKVFYYLGWKPKTRVSSKEYLIDELVMPATANGFYYKCVDPGVSAASAPTFANIADELTTDGTVQWQAIPFEFKLKSGDSISLSNWVGTSGVTVDNQGSDQGITWCRVTAAPSSGAFEITNTVEVTRSDGKVESFDRTLVIGVKAL